MSLRYTDKLKHREQLLLDYAAASGEVNAYDILSADFAGMAPLPVLQDSSHYGVKIKPFHIGLRNAWQSAALDTKSHAQMNVAAKAAYFTSIFWLKLYTNAKMLKGYIHANADDNRIMMRHDNISIPQLAASTLSHENIHHLQKFHVTDTMRRMSDEDYTENHFSNYAELRRLQSISNEMELMPRLHALISDYTLTGAGIPQNYSDFYDMLKICQIELYHEKTGAALHQQEEIKQVITKQLPADFDDIDYFHFIEQITGEADDIRYFLESPDSDKKNKARGLLVSAFARTMQLYGYNISYENLYAQSLPHYAAHINPACAIQKP